MKNKRSESVP